MRYYVSFFFLIIACTPKDSTHKFEYRTPISAGFSESGLDSLSIFLEAAGSSAMLLMVDGKIVYEWGDTEKAHTIHSIRKSMLNSIFGIAVHEGLIDTNATLLELGIDDTYQLTDLEKSARVADLLKSRSGVYHPAAAVSEGMMIGKPERNSYKPGEHYYYNNWDFNVLGHILEQETGKSIYALYHEQIAIPLGMHHYDGSYSSFDVDSIENEDEFNLPNVSGFYQYESSKSKYPAYHFRMSALDMALYGQLYLNEGKWGNKQMIPQLWIKQSTKPISIYNQRFGLSYGMLWNVLAPTETRDGGSFYHTGTGVHMLGVYPESNMVLVHRVDTEKDYTFDGDDLLNMIDLVFEAKE
jgi:CubicO group peptidase (beta-lactamase class C family)